MFIDSHTHLTSREFDADRDDVVARAGEAGVGMMVNPGTDLEDSRAAVDLADRTGGVYACVGVHPHEARKADRDTVKKLQALLSHPKVVGIGEIGLDFHYDFSPRDVQKSVFAFQLELAATRDLPVVIHTRESLAETVEIVEDSIRRFPDWGAKRAFPGSRYPGPRGVFHCYPGDVQTAWKLIELGFYISFPGIVTFKNAGLAAEVAARVSLEHFLLETDSPYLAPVPRRGERNEPANIPLIAARIAELQHLSVDDVARATNYSAHRLFGIGQPTPPQFTYRLRNSLYLNLTIRCNADCMFCDRKAEAVLKGNNLRIDREPDVREVIAEIGDPTRYDEIVFCGFGEPTIRLDAVKEIARWVKARGGRTRLNTDGHGNVINRRNIVPELVDLIDAVSISLNSPDPDQYGSLMRIDGMVYFPAMVEFARECVRLLPSVAMTVVDLDDVNMEKARNLVEDAIGATFIRRPYF